MTYEEFCEGFQAGKREIIATDAAGIKQRMTLDAHINSEIMPISCPLDEVLVFIVNPITNEPESVWLNDMECWA